jgi:hypothetical protein
MEPASLFHDVTLGAFALHIGGGTAALVSGTTALLASKGGALHRKAGNIFFVSMLVMAIFAIYLAVAMPDQLPNVFIATFAFYLIATAWMTARRQESEIGMAEKIALAIILVVFLPFAVLSFQLAAGLPTFVRSAVPLKGPVLVAIYSFTAVIAIAAMADVRMVIRGGITGVARIARHLWRMCVGLTLAAGSAFTNGLIRLVPHSWHVPDIVYFLPQFVPLVFLAFWMIRVRFTQWYRRTAEVPSAIRA